MSRYEVLRERNKREEFALRVSDALIAKYFKKPDSTPATIEDGQLYNWRIRTEASELLNFKDVKLYLPSYMFEFKVIQNSLDDKPNCEISSVFYKFISEDNFNEWREKYNFDLSNVKFSTGEIQYYGNDCTEEHFNKLVEFLSQQFEQVLEVISTAVKSFKKYYKDMQIKTISLKDSKK